MDKVTGRLENWSYDSIYNVVWGDIHDDIKGRFRNGQRIHTSAIPKTQMTRSPVQFYEGTIVETLNSRYILGKRAE